MDIVEFRNFCLSFEQVTEEFPFDESTLVFKVLEKMFALTDVDRFDGINLKCEPQEVVRLREAYKDVHPGYHMNKQHWITVDPKGDVPDQELKAWIKESYRLVVVKMPAKKRNLLTFKG